MIVLTSTLCRRTLVTIVWVWPAAAAPAVAPVEKACTSAMKMFGNSAAPGTAADRGAVTTLMNCVVVGGKSMTKRKSNGPKVAGVTVEWRVQVTLSALV